MSLAHTPRLLRRVAWRLTLVRVARSAYVALLVAAGLYAALLLVQRFTGLLPDVFTWPTLLAVPAVGVGVLWHRRPTVAEAARAVDLRMRTRDLFLTAAFIDGTPGEYQPLVVREAERRAPDIQPAAVVPYEPWPRSGHATLALVALLAAVAWLPTLDPFGERAEAEQLAERREQLEKEREATIRRAAELQKASPEAEHSRLVEQQLDELKQTFDLMKPDDPKGNLAKLAQQREQLESLWRRMRQQQMDQSLAAQSMTQRFGGGDFARQQQWKKKLEAGKLDSVQQELNELKQLTEQLAQSKDPVQQQQLRQQIEQRLQNLSQFAQNSMNSPGASQALQRAMQQLDMSAQGELSQEALEALQQSLALSEMEMQSAAQQMRDLQALQQALQAAQTAQALNQMQPLDGQQAAGQCQTIGDYYKLYQQQLAQCMGGGQGQGVQWQSIPQPIRQGMGGMGGPGRGRGGIAPEDPTQQNQFQTEREQTALHAGRLLMQWKTREVSEAGEVQTDYQSALAQVRQGASEAVLREEISPGYQDTIRQYFDRIEETVPTSVPSPSPGDSETPHEP